MNVAGASRQRCQKKKHAKAQNATHVAARSSVSVSPHIMFMQVDALADHGHSQY
jgi:hypothetical protein